MGRILRAIIMVWALMAMTSCSRRTHPERTRKAWAAYKVTPIPTATTHYEKSTPLTESPRIAETKLAPPAPRPEDLPKVITVNARAAHRSIDGRYYFDVDGHRYWRNKYDGKYYLFNKSMFNDPAFMPPKKNSN